MTTNPETPTVPARQRWARDVATRIQAADQMLLVETREPGDAYVALRHAVGQLDQGEGAPPLVCWDCVRGFHLRHPDPELARSLRDQVAAIGALPGLGSAPDDPDAAPLGDPTLTHPVAAVRAVTRFRVPDASATTEDEPGDAVFVFFNFLEYLGDPQVRQVLETLAANNELQRVGLARPLVFVQATPVPEGTAAATAAAGMRHWMTEVPLPLPDLGDLEADVVPEVVEATAAAFGAEAAAAGANPETRRALAGALLGLERHRAVTVGLHAASVNRGVSAAMLADCRRGVAAAVAAGSPMRLVPEEQLLDPADLGGIDNVLAYLGRAARSLSDAARAQHLVPPRGFAFCGVPGTGKTSACRAAPRIFQRETGRPFALVEVSIADFFGGLVGQTEANWRDFVKRVEAIGDVIVFIDEIDKAFRDVMGGGGDSGVRRGLFGQFVAWLGQPASRRFVVLAMNETTGLPPELLRRVRPSFFFDLPDAASRQAILRIHARKQLRPWGKTLDDLGLDDAAWARLAALADRFIPSELEEVVSEARERAFEARQLALPTYEELAAAVRRRQGRTLSSQFEGVLRTMRDNRAFFEPAAAEVPASPPPPSTEGDGPRRRRLRKPADDTFDEKDLN